MGADNNLGGRHDGQEQQASPEGLQVLDRDGRQGVIHRWREFHNLEDGNAGAKAGHRTLADGIYSPKNLFALSAIHEAALGAGRREAGDSASRVMVDLTVALDVLENYKDEGSGEDLSGAFKRAQEGVVDGDTTWSQFLVLMAHARRSAAETINKYRNVVLPNTAVDAKGRRVGFATVADAALAEYRESVEGVDFGVEFENRLFDPDTKVLVISVDVNSTLNTGESFASMPMLDKVNASLEVLANRFRRAFPEKQLYVVLNTGRPVSYLWGTLEMLQPIPEMREFGLAENGGVLLEMDRHQMRNKVMVSQPELWKEKLDQLKDHLKRKISGRRGVVDEPKLSMLSLKIAGAGDNWIHRTEDGVVVTPDWIEKEMGVFFDNSAKNIGSRIREIHKVVEVSSRASEVMEAFKEWGGALENGDASKVINLDPGQRRVLQQILQDAGGRSEEIQELEDELGMIYLMRSELVCNYNSTAGYVDIGHRNLNKYSALATALERKSFSPDSWLVVHVGDSTTDIMPVAETGLGEVNQGADEVFLVAVNDSSDGLKKAVSARGPKGLISSRVSVLGLGDTVLGVRRVVDKRLVTVGGQR